MAPDTADPGTGAREGTDRANPVWRRALPWLVVLVVALTPFFVPIPRNLNHHPVIGALWDKVHIPLFFFFTILFWWRGPLTGRVWWSALAAVVLGGLVEFAQPWLGRSARFNDFELDLIGIGLAVCWLEWRRIRSWWGLAGGLALTAVVVAQLAYLPGFIEARRVVREHFPVLADFSDSHSPQLWRTTSGATVAFPALAGPRGRVMRLRGAPPERWPGAVMHYFPADWSAYGYLVFRARAVDPSPTPAILAVRLDDEDSRLDPAWYTKRFEVTADWRWFAVPLAELRDVANIRGDRPLRLDEMDSVLFFFPRPAEIVTVEIDDIGLSADLP